jgi:Putative effector of murein hydrolase LrgA
MKFVFQLCVILLISFIGEILRQVIPLPIPASIYGLMIMLFCLSTKIIKLEQVKKAGYILIEIMPVLFIPPAAGLIPAWPQLSGVLVPVIVITLATTLIVMVVSGRVTQALLNKNGGAGR